MIVSVKAAIATQKSVNAVRIVNAKTANVMPKNVNAERIANVVKIVSVDVAIKNNG
jgi:hypothetical protein